jgi:TonB-dependent starch-binding outer membrane protein SusC
MKLNAIYLSKRGLWAVFLLFSLSVVSAQTITGRVTDSQNEPLIGASVVVAGTTKGVITNEKGDYSLDATGVDKTASLVFSFVGFDNQRIAINGRTVIDVILQEGKSLNEVVVVGYGIQKKRDLTGSVATANLDAFREAPNVSILQSLKGSLPGLTISQTNRPGQEASINIRGRSTLNGNTSPLIIVDGFIYGGRLSDINPIDVDRVDILKDPSSKAIYGSQAANGVVLMTTKTGKVAQKPTITYSGNYAVSSPTVNARLLNREEFLEKVRNIEYKNAYTQASGYKDRNPAWTFANSDFLPPNIAGANNTTNDYDWFSNLTQPSVINSHALGISGGSDHTTYYLSTGVTDEKGYITNDNYKRYTFRLNMNTDVTKWLNIGAKTAGSFTDFSGDAPGMDNIITTSPLVTPKDANGNWVINPLGDVNVNPFLNSLADNKETQSRLEGNFFATIKVPGVEGLTYRLNFGNNLKFFKTFSSSPYGAGRTGEAFKNDATQYDQTLDNIVNYSKSFGNHTLDFTGVYGYNTSKFNRTEARGTGLPDLTLSYNNLSLAEIQKISSEAWNEALLYQVGSVAYNYKSKYLFKATVRRDGFSGFSKNNKTGIFPSFGAGWVVTEEPFFKIKGLDYLKIRGSYGENGNKVGRYSSLARVTAEDASKYVFGDGGSTSIGRSVSTLANENLKWERTRGVNIGADFEILGGKLDGNVEYYNSDTYDLLWSKILPQVSGFSSVLTNIGQLNNKGFEFLLHGTPLKTRGLKWEISVNFTQNKNKIVKLLGEDLNKDGIEDDLIASGLFIGRPISTIYDYQVEGVYGLDDTKIAGFEAGSYKIKDQDGDGKISADKDRIILGQRDPAYSFGIQNSLSFKGFTFRFFLNSFQGGKDSYLALNHLDGYNGTKGNASNSNSFNFAQYWSPANPSALYANPWVGTPTPGARRFFQRNFTRLQDVSLAYSVDKNTLKRLKMQGLKVFVSG